MDKIQIILAFLWALIVSLYAVPSIVELAWKKGLMDSFDERKVHNLLTPRLGGVAIFAGTFSGILIFGEVDRFIQYLLAALLLVFFIGVRDDLNEIGPWKKFIVQILAAFIIFYEGEFLLKSFYGFFGIGEISEVFSYLFCLMVVIVITNSINFIDGLDGLAGTLSLIAATMLGIFFIETSFNLAIVSFCLGGSLIGFLRYNIKKSAVFMGDSGSMFMGLLIAVLCLKQIELRMQAISFIYIYAILFVPITDFIRVIISRVVRKISPLTAGRDHIHHILLDSGLSQSRILVMLAVLSLAVIVITMLMAFYIQLASESIIFVLIVLSITLSVYCEITFKKISA